METRKQAFSYLSYEDASELTSTDTRLVEEAREVTAQAYAPYSNFHVGALIRLANGQIVTGANQENASFPAGLCAERVALSAATSLYPGVPIHTIVITYRNLNGSSDTPISPCGICRQSLYEYEYRQQSPIRIILSGESGKVFVIQSVSHLLPLVFSATDMK